MTMACLGLTRLDYTLLKPKRHSLRCHGFMVHAFLLLKHTNVVDFRVMRRLCRRKWNWLWNWRCVNQHSWDPWQRTTWSWRVTSDFNSVFCPTLTKKKEATLENDISRKWANDAPRNTPGYCVVCHHLASARKSCRIIWCVVQREHIVENCCDLLGF